MTLYFVVRTDVRADDGQQRVFDVFDTLEEAEARVTYLAARVMGEFAVYEGEPHG